MTKQRQKMYRVSDAGDIMEAEFLIEVGSSWRMGNNSCHFACHKGDYKATKIEAINDFVVRAIARAAELQRQAKLLGEAVALERDKIAHAQTLVRQLLKEQEQ